MFKLNSKNLTNKDKQRVMKSKPLILKNRFCMFFCLIIYFFETLFFTRRPWYSIQLACLGEDTPDQRVSSSCPQLSRESPADPDLLEELTSRETSDSALMLRRLLTGAELRVYIFTSGIKKWNYLHSCLST